MNNLPLLLCLLVVLIGRGHCLSCVTCSDQTGLTCSGPQETCAANQDVCLTGVSLGGNLTGMFTRCSTSLYCNLFYSEVFRLERYDNFYSCCREDNCVPSLSDFFPVTNGLQCPFFFSDANESVQILECRGDQTKCYNLTASPPGGHCLSCVTCSNQTGLTCSGPQETCAANQDVCLTNIISVEKIRAMTTGCDTSLSCNLSFSFTYGLEIFDNFYSCCREDSCVPSLSDFFPLANGLQCPFFFSFTNESVRILECKGDQTKCYNATTTPTGGDIYFMLGCANDNLCYFKDPNTQFTCQNASAIGTSTTTSSTTSTSPTTTTTTSSTANTSTTTTSSTANTSPTTTTTTTSSTTNTSTATTSSTTNTSLTNTTTSAMSTFTTRTTTTKTTTSSSSVNEWPSSFYSRGHLILFGLFSIYVSDRIVNLYM
ncbi:mucin-2-like [Hyla sarda]|uniref:mucin-2-like n=1 Tax=Hyla sarda TaxID=327740 RepID=UPI0024C46EBC|nr:mucin-2-like [Hyla sarda]